MLPARPTGEGKLVGKHAYFLSVVAAVSNGEIALSEAAEIASIRDDLAGPPVMSNVEAQPDRVVALCRFDVPYFYGQNKRNRLCAYRHRWRHILLLLIAFGVARFLQNTLRMFHR